MSTDPTRFDDDTQEDPMSTEDTAGPGRPPEPSWADSPSGTDTGTGTGADPVRPAGPPPVPVLRGPALGTIVWGFVVLAVAGLVGAWELADIRVDLSLVLPVGMVTVGLLLVVGALVTALRDRT